MINNTTIMTNSKFKNFKIKANLGFLGIEGFWEIDQTQRNAAWEIYIELITRVTVVELKDNEGLLREALSSFYALFDLTRNILKKYGPGIATPSQPTDTTLGHIAVAVLNKVLRPLLAQWHPILKEHEDKRSKNISVPDHEREWSHAQELRQEIRNIQEQLVEYANVLAQVSGVSKLH